VHYPPSKPICPANGDVLLSISAYSRIFRQPWDSGLPLRQSTSISPHSSVGFADTSQLRWAIEIDDFDGNMDFLFQIKVRELNLDESSTEAIPTGEIFGDMLLFGMG
jgi:hypothetical protein